MTSTEKKLKKLIVCTRQESLNYILAGVNLVAVLGAAVSLWCLLLLIPCAFFMGMAIYWGIQQNLIEEELDKEQEEERKEVLAFADELLESNSTEDLKGWNMHKN